MPRENTGKILKLNSIHGERKWIGTYMLIFNTCHWWYHRGVTQLWDYIQLGNQVVNDMNRLYAMEQALIAWGRWVDSNVVSNKTLVFFQGVSPIHYKTAGTYCRYLGWQIVGWLCSFPTWTEQHPAMVLQSVSRTAGILIRATYSALGLYWASC